MNRSTGVPGPNAASTAATLVAPRIDAVQARFEGVPHVGAGAEPAPCAGHHERTDVLILVGCADRGCLLGRHAGRPCIEPIGAVEGEQRDLAATFVRDGPIAHAALLAAPYPLPTGCITVNHAP